MRKNRMAKKKVFTLLEIIMVVVIVGILVGLGLPNYFKAIERTHNKEAISMIKLIVETEKMYKLEQGDYSDGCITNELCNSLLDLDLPVGEERNWDYSVTVPFDKAYVHVSAGRHPDTHSAYRFWDYRTSWAPEPLKCTGVPGENDKYCE